MDKESEKWARILWDYLHLHHHLEKVWTVMWQRYLCTHLCNSCKLSITSLISITISVITRLHVKQTKHLFFILYFHIQYVPYTVAACWNLGHQGADEVQKQTVLTYCLHTTLVFVNHTLLLNIADTKQHYHPIVACVWPRDKCKSLTFQLRFGLHQNISGTNTLPTLAFVLS